MKKDYTEVTANVYVKCMALHELLTPRVRAEGLRWYFDAHNGAVSRADRYRATLARDPLTTVCGLYGAASSRLKWEYTSLAVDHMLARTWTYDTDGSIQLPLGTLRPNGTPAVVPIEDSNLDKMFHILHTGDVWSDKGLHYGPTGGHKTYSFAMNIMDPTDVRYATIDVWMVRLLGYESWAMGKLLYEAITTAVIAAAVDSGILPHQLQAQLWILARDICRLGKGEHVTLRTARCTVHCGYVFPSEA
jgi:hypothetical protein